MFFVFFFSEIAQEFLNQIFDWAIPQHTFLSCLFYRNEVGILYFNVSRFIWMSVIIHFINLIEEFVSLESFYFSTNRENNNKKKLSKSVFVSFSGFACAPLIRVQFFQLIILDLLFSLAHFKGFC